MRPSFLVLAAVSLVTGCTPVVVGNGQVTTVTRNVGAFRQVQVEGSLKAIVKPGERVVSISADENLQQYIEVSVVGDTLVLRKDFIEFASAHVQITVTNDAVEAVHASGAADVQAVATATSTFAVSASGASKVNIVDIASSSVSVDASGSSNVTLAGSAASADVKVSGSSDLVMTQLPLGEATIALSGASTLRAAVSNSISGSASGASGVIITGNPVSTVQLSGSSTLKNGQ